MDRFEVRFLELALVSDGNLHSSMDRFEVLQGNYSEQTAFTFTFQYG